MKTFYTYLFVTVAACFFFPAIALADHCDFMMHTTSHVQLLNGANREDFYLIRGCTIGAQERNCWTVLVSAQQLGELRKDLKHEYLTKPDPDCILHSNCFKVAAVHFQKPVEWDWRNPPSGRSETTALLPTCRAWDVMRDDTKSLKYILLSKDPLIVGEVEDNKANDAIISTLLDQWNKPMNPTKAPVAVSHRWQ